MYVSILQYDTSATIQNYAGFLREVGREHEAKALEMDFDIK